MIRHATLLLAILVGLPAAAQQDTAEVDVGGYGSFRYELSDAVRGSFTLRRFVLTTGARWRDRLQAYAGAAYEGTSEGQVALEQAWAQLRLGPVTARAGALLPPVGRFNLYHQ